MTAPPATRRTRFAVQPDVRRLNGGATLLGGVPRRILRLSRAGTNVLDALLEDGLAESDQAGAQLATRLVGADVLVPLPAPRRPATGEVTVCIPSFNGATRLPPLLERLDGFDVVVVDDGSTDATAAVAGRAGAHVARSTIRRGPAAARNTGLKAISTPLVAFLDDDCLPEPGWLEPLLAHVHAGAPHTAAVAPRVVATGGTGLLARYDAAASPLDLGTRAGAVGPARTVPYVPSAALLVRRSALLEVGGFAEDLRHGEDVDLCWRLSAAGWTVRYEPAVRVAHASRDGAVAMLRQRFAYGTAAAPLAKRHPQAVAPVRLTPRTAAAATAALTGQPAVTIAIGAAAVRGLRRALPSDVPRREAARLCGGAYVAALAQAARAARREWLPVSLAATAGSRRVRRSLLLATTAEAAAAWASGPRSIPLVPFVLLRACDDAAYAAGVWAGCLRTRTLAPLRPAS